MTGRSLVVCLAVAAAVVSCRTRAAELLPETGDLVFETSGSRQSAAIQWATRSRWSHVGIVDRSGGEVVVIEALGKVSRTHWKAWTRRARRDGPYLVLRPRGLAPAQRQAAVAEARLFLGRRYDPRFGWDDDRIYCSELVVKAYQRGAGVTLGRRERLGDLRLTGIERAMEKRWGGPVPKDLVLVTPASIAEDPRLAPVTRPP
jgi:cell wall-associated NlpC family hydrolase